LESELQAVGSTLVPLEENIVDLAWGSERPSAPTDPVIVQPVEYAGTFNASRHRHSAENLAISTIPFSDLTHIHHFLTHRSQPSR
jgi:hypothetical protein